MFKLTKIDARECDRHLFGNALMQDITCSTFEKVRQNSLQKGSLQGQFVLLRLSPFKITQQCTICITSIRTS